MSRAPSPEEVSVMSVPELFAPGFSTDPYWWDSAPRPDTDDADPPSRCDVIVVGSGYTGLNAALDLARGGRDVAVLDADSIGHGASTRSAGFVTSWVHQLSMLRQKFGDDMARSLARQVKESSQFTLARIASEGIRCELDQRGQMMLAHNPKAYEHLARDVEIESQIADVEYALVPKAELHREIATDLYCGALVRPNESNLHPGLYVNGLIERVRDAGAQLLSRTPVRGIERERDRLAVATSRGTISARNVVIATNGYTDSALAHFRRRVLPVPAYMMATEPLGKEQVKRLLPTLRAIADTRINFYCFRPTADGERILFSADHGNPNDDPRATVLRMRRLMLQVFPDLREARFTHCWKGYIAFTRDLLPKVGEIDGVHYALGWGGAGIATGSYMGHKVARQILGAADATTVFSGREFKNLPRGMSWMVPIGRRIVNLVDRFSERAT
jgi:glycine/D-amino acid oxidase-like deaminating enzyme